MTEKLRVFLGNRRISVPALCQALGISSSRLSDLALEITNGPDITDGPEASIERFYSSWLAGDLPVSLRPCSSRLLHKLYCLWCRRNGLPAATETKFLTLLPPSIQKMRRHIDLEEGRVIRTVLEPEGCRSPMGEALASYLGRENAAFLTELATMERGE